VTQFLTSFSTGLAPPVLQSSPTADVVQSPNSSSVGSFGQPSLEGSPVNQYGPVADSSFDNQCKFSLLKVVLGPHLRLCL
jgi:hypothetical protein